MRFPQLVCLIFCFPVVAQSVRNFDDTDLQRVVDELQPVIEEVCGRKYKQPPQVFLADSGDMMRVLRVELQPVVDAEFKGQRKSRIRRALQLRADASGISLIGKLEISSGELLVVPPRVRQSIASLKIDDANELSVLKLIIAHEMVHLLQRQEARFKERFEQVVDRTSLESLNLRMEGHAVMCSELVLTKLGLADSVMSLRSLFSGAVEGRNVVGSPLHARGIASMNAVTYLLSSDIFAAVYAAHGSEGAWRLVSEEGARLSFLRSSEESQILAYLDGCFEGVEEFLASKNWLVGKSDLSLVSLLSSLYLRKNEALEQLKSCEGGAAWSAFGVTPLIQRSVVALRFKNESAATSFRQLFELCALDDLRLYRARTDIDLIIAGIQGSPKEDRVEVVDQPWSTGGVWRTLAQDKYRLNPEVQVHWIQSGSILLEITCINAPATTEALNSAAEMIISRLKI